MRQKNKKGTDVFYARSCTGCILSVLFSCPDCRNSPYQGQHFLARMSGPGIVIELPRRRFVRRRSSAFRPSNLSYPLRERFNSTSELVEESIGHDSGLESLPYSILLLIFVHSKTKDLLNLCLLSKYTYLPAAVQLYKKIVVIDSYEKYDFLRKYLQDVSLNLGTFVRVKNLEKLYQVIQASAKLCQIVKSIIYVNYTIDDDIVINKLKKIMENVRLNELFIPHVSLHDISLLTYPQAFDSIQRLGITTGVADFREAQTKLSLPLLSHLKIYYEGEENDKQMSLLLNLLGDSLENLQFLEFQKYVTSDFQPLQILNQANSMRANETYPLPVWVLFLRLFRQQTAKKLSLTGLGVDGYLGSHGVVVLELLHGTIDLESLRHLQLNITELTHGHSPHFHNALHSTFLYSLSVHTPNLVKLAVNPTHDCLLCQRDCLMEVVCTRLANKLTTLVLNVELPDPESSLALNTKVAESQANLINFKIFDKSKVFHDKLSLYKVFDDIFPELKNLYEHAEYYEADIRKKLFSNYFLYDIESISSSIVNEYSVQELLTYRTNSIVIDDYMIAVIDKVKKHPKFNEFLLQYFADNKLTVQIKNCIKLKYFQILGFPIYIETGEGGQNMFLMKNFGDPYYYIGMIPYS